MKALVVSNVGRHYRKFRYYDIEKFCTAGFEVDFASNFDLEEDKFEDKRIKKLQVPFSRNPIDYDNIRAIGRLYRIIKYGNYEFIHCQSPVAGAITRVVCIMLGYKNVYYTAHGFHFYRGAPIYAWLLYFPIEWILALFTKRVIVINEEDYSLAQRIFPRRNVCLVNGIGFREANRALLNDRIKREDFGLRSEDILLICVGELNRNKNQIMLLKAMNIVKRRKDIFALIVGVGCEENKLKKYIDKVGISAQIRFLGYRSDVADLLSISDIYISTSLREGLPVSVLEAMDSSLPLILSRCRGNRELVKDGVNGYLIDQDDYKTMAEMILRIADHKALREEFGEMSYNLVEEYRSKNIEESIYKAFDLCKGTGVPSETNGVIKE